MARKSRTMSGEDTAALERATYHAMEEYKRDLDNVSIGDMIETFDGNKGDLARALAGIGEGKLPARGTSERTRYDSQMKNISRWLNYENGERGPQARNPEFASSQTQSRLKDLYIANNPPQGMTVSIEGWIGYEEGDYRYRDIDIPAEGKEIDTDAFLAAMRAGDTHAAYRVVFNAYAPALSCSEATQLDVSFY